MFEFNLEKKPDPPASTLPPDVFFKLVIIGFLLLGAAITVGLWWRWEMHNTRQQEREALSTKQNATDVPVIEEDNTQDPPEETAKSKSETEAKQETNITGHSPESNDFGLTEEELYRLQNLTPALETCLRNGGGKGCLKYDYKPNPPETQSSTPSVYRAVQPSAANGPVATAYYSGRILHGWQPNYTMAPMRPGVCPPSLIIQYQGNLFCGRRPIANVTPARRQRRFW